MSFRLFSGRVASLLCALAIGLACASAHAAEETGPVAILSTPSASDHSADAPTIVQANLAWTPRAPTSLIGERPVGLMTLSFKLEQKASAASATASFPLATMNGWVNADANAPVSKVIASLQSGRHKLSLTAGLVDKDELTGLPTAIRPTAQLLSDAPGLQKRPVPQLGTISAPRQPPYANPVINMDRRLYGRPGYYLKLAWQLPAPVTVDYLHYDNDVDPRSVSPDLEWGWRTRYEVAGAVADLSRSLQLRVQGLSGSTRMGYSMGGRLWVDTRFQAGYAMLTRQLERGSVSARVETFRTRNRGSAINAMMDETGWAASLAARHEAGPRLSISAEAMHVRSDLGTRYRLDPLSWRSSNQVRIRLRARW